MSKKNKKVTYGDNQLEILLDYLRKNSQLIIRMRYKGRTKQMVYDIEYDDSMFCRHAKSEVYEFTNVGDLIKTCEEFQDEVIPEFLNSTGLHSYD